MDLVLQLNLPVLEDLVPQGLLEALVVLDLLESLEDPDLLEILELLILPKDLLFLVDLVFQVLLGDLVDL